MEYTNTSWPLKQTSILSVSEARCELARLQDCIAADAKRAAEMQKIIDAAPKSLLTKPVAGSGCDYWAVSSAVGTGGNRINNYAAHEKADRSYAGGNIFTDRATAEAYADALDTLLMLRHQPGSEAVNSKYQYCIQSCDQHLGSGTWMDPDSKVRMISPCFHTEAVAKAAIITIGTDRILRMFRTLHGVA